jgi:predicted  nucleic acid-binding Zn-ribbon protein
MSDATKDLKDNIRKEIEHLEEVRDELRVKLALAKAEAREEWNRLETSWDRIQDDLKRVGEQAKEQAKEPAAQISHAAHDLVQELKRGYERLRAQFKAHS